MGKAEREGSLSEPSTPNFVQKTPAGALTITTPTEVRRSGAGGGVGSWGVLEGVTGKASRKRGLLERSLTKFLWSVRWQTNCWQRNFLAQRPRREQL